ncbi:MAG TPA: transporter substrate-binding domain-containing protein [Chthoniobacteraceae bacterium]
MHVCRRIGPWELESEHFQTKAAKYCIAAARALTYEKPVVRSDSLHSLVPWWTVALLAVTAGFLVGGCGEFPRDAAGTLKRGRVGGELRVGAVEHAPWVRWEGEHASGIEPELIDAWARQIGANVRWRRGAVAELAGALHRREIDVLIAGFKDDTPHASEIALTQPYVKTHDLRGKKESHVLAVMPGENALLLSLDRFLAGQDAEAFRKRAESEQAKP